jgi:murein DD-endopeptidase MepM/ murein hydrolase activator NlpD
LEIPKQKTSASNNYADGGSTDYQSTGDVVMPDTGIPNWGDPENKADFFRASQALLDKQKADEQAAAPKTIESRPLPAPTDKGERVDPDQTKAPTVVGTGDTVFPVVGTFSGGPRSYYGAERPSLSGYMRLHAGADWQASNGSGVYAPVDGKVVYSGQHSGYGNMVDVLGNDGYVRRFAVHDGDVLVKPGDAVSAGQQIGTVGGQHLHHEVLKPDSSAATLAIKGQFGQTSRVGGRDEQTLDPSSFYKLKSGTKVYGPAGLTPPAARKDGGRVGHITYNLDPDIHGRKHSGYSKEGGRITWMSPEEFLAKVPQKLRLDRKSEKTVEHFKDKIKKGKKLNPLAIFPNNGGQDGRHRAMAAKELGIKKVPVIQWPPGHTVVSRALMLTSKKA